MDSSFLFDYQGLSVNLLKYLPTLNQSFPPSPHLPAFFRGFFELLSKKSLTRVYKKSQVCGKPLTGNVVVMSEVESSQKIRKIQQLMQSHSFADLIWVEKELKRYKPQDLPTGILDVWLNSSNSGEQCRALRVQGAWGNKYHR